MRVLPHHGSALTVMGFGLLYDVSQCLNNELLATPARRPAQRQQDLHRGGPYPSPPAAPLAVSNISITVRSGIYIRRRRMKSFPAGDGSQLQYAIELGSGGRSAWM